MKIDEMIIKECLCKEHLDKLTIDRLIKKMREEEGIIRCWACNEPGEIPYRDTSFHVCEKHKWMN